MLFDNKNENETKWNEKLPYKWKIRQTNEVLYNTN